MALAAREGVDHGGSHDTPFLTHPARPHMATDPTSPFATAAVPDRLAARSRQFERFADTECHDDPLYVALCRLLAARPQALAWLDAAAPTQQRPNLWLAALHERVLAGAAEPLAAWYRSVGGQRQPDESLATALDDVLAAQGPALRALLATRATQTNEIGRCAVLWPALAEIAAQAGGRPLALLDVGCSAGLNLGVDRFAYSHGERRLGVAPGPGVPMLACHPVGGRPPPSREPPHLATRLGIDPTPVDVRDADALRWLRACVWPHEVARLERLDQAAALLRTEGWPVRREADCLAAIEPWLDSLPPGVQPVVFNSWVLAYLEPAALAAHVAAMRSLVQRRGVAWLSAEGAGLRLGDDGPDDLPPPPPADDRVSDAELANATLWWCLRPGPAGQPQARLLARSHPHGRWLAWTG